MCEMVIDSLVGIMFEGLITTVVEAAKREKKKRQIKKCIEDWMERNKKEEEKYELILSLFAASHNGMMEFFWKKVKNPKIGESQRKMIEMFLQQYGKSLGIEERNKNIAFQILTEVYDIYWKSFEVVYVDEIKLWVKYGNAYIDEAFGCLSELIEKYDVQRRIKERQKEISEFIDALAEYKSETEIKFCNRRTRVEIELPETLEDEWRNFLEKPSWRVCVKDSLDKVKMGIKSEWDEIENWYRNDIDTIALNKKSFQVCRKKIEDALKKIRKDFYWVNVRNTERNAFEKLLRNLEREIGQPFNKCFLLTGEKGDGKTAFLYYLLQNHKKEYFFYIDISLLDVEMIPEFIVKQMNQELGIIKQNLEEVNSIFEEAERKLVIFVDNLDSLLLREDRDKQIKRLELILEKTELHQIYWILCMRERSIGMLQGTDWLAGEYSYVPKTSCVIGNWINLHEINYEEKIPLRMLRAQLRLTEEREELYLAEMKYYNFDINKYSPQRVQDMLNIQKDDILKMTNFVQINYVRSVYQQYKKEFERADLEVNKILRPRAEYVLNSLGQYFYENPKDKYCERKDIFGSALAHMKWNQKEQSNLVWVLEYCYLLKEIGEEKKAAEIVYMLDTDTIWAYKIAGIVHEENKNWLEDCKRFSKMPIYDQIFELVVLLGQKEGKFTEQESFYEEVFTEKCFWFAAVEFDDTWKAQLCNYICEKNEQIVKCLDRQGLFGYLYYLKYTQTDNVSCGTKFRLLQEFYKNVAETELDYYLLSVIRNILDKVTSKEELLDSLLYFRYSEFLDIIQEMADAVTDILHILCGGNAIEMLLLVTQYCRNNSSIVIDSVKRGLIGPFFYERFLANVCRKFLREQKEIDFRKIYKSLVYAGWYREENDDKLSAWLRKAANLEMGRYYRELITGNRRCEIAENSYVELVKKLAEGEMFEVEIAFYLIKHSVSHIKGRSRVVRSTRLKCILGQLWENKTLQTRNTSRDNVEFWMENGYKREKITKQKYKRKLNGKKQKKQK